MTSSSPIEVSLYNPAARRQHGGIWNEDTLPVAEWEDAEHRVVLPESIQQPTGIETPVLRWSADKRRRVLKQRPTMRYYVDRIDEFLANWTYVGLEPWDGGAWNAVFPDGDRLTVAIFGPDRNGSWNMVTMHPLRGRQVDRAHEDWMILREGK